MSAFNIIMPINVVDGVAEFSFPRGLKIDNYQSCIAVHSIESKKFPKKVAYIACNASVFKTEQNLGYDLNVLGCYDGISDEALTLHFFQCQIKAPLNMLRSKVQLYVRDINDDVIKVNGRLIVEIFGEVERSILL